MKLYLDSSALMKLVSQEQESGALVAFIREGGYDGSLVTSALTVVEMSRVAMPLGPDAVALLKLQLERIDQVAIGRDVIELAASLAPAQRLRSLDALHIASALLMRDEVATLLTYDHRMAEAARGEGLEVFAPGQSPSSS